MIALFMTAWFWVVIVETIILFVCVAKDEGTGATVTFIAALLLLQFLPGGYDVWGFIQANPWRIVYTGAAYFACGAFWSILKWQMFLMDAKKELLKDRKKHSPVHHGYKASWHKPMIEQHKARAMRWIGLWPFSVIWTIIEDWLKRAVELVFDSLKAVFQKMSDRMFVEFDEIEGLSDDILAVDKTDGRWKGRFYLTKNEWDRVDAVQRDKISGLFKFHARVRGSWRDNGSGLNEWDYNQLEVIPGKVEYKLADQPCCSAGRRHEERQS